MKFKRIFAAGIVIAGISPAFAQDNIGTEVVNVVKPYTPTISDAFKVKETPVIEDEENSKKADIKYNIFSFPVASTFTPSKGRAAGVEKEPKETLYQNYATLAGGNYTTINGELFLTTEVGSNGYIGGMVRHFSSGGGIDEVRLEDGFHNSSIDITYGNRSDTFSWTADVGYQNQGYNWYGLPEGFLDGLDEEATRELLASVDPSHTYHNASVGGSVIAHESFFDEVQLRYNRFWDSDDSEENRFYIKPKFTFDIADTSIKTNFIVDHVSGSFRAASFLSETESYGFTNFGVHPSFNIVRDDWSINVGAAAFYSMASEGGDSKFFIYPMVNASYKLVGDLMIFYAGAEGGLEQNSYRDFTNENPFLMPGVFVAPTDRQYDVFAGLKGKLANRVSYNVRGSFVSEDNKALFHINDYYNVFSEDYEFGNSFGVVYDRVTTLSFFGELRAEFSKNVSFGVNGTFNSYSTDDQAEAWNLPTLRLGASLDVDITKKWYAGADVFFVGERKDRQDNLDDVIEPEITTLDPFVDLNAHVGYKHNERLTGFLKVNNIIGENYERWMNYPVQGIQVLLGASYKFNF